MNCLLTDGSSDILGYFTMVQKYLVVKMYFIDPIFIRNAKYLKIKGFKMLMKLYFFPESAKD